MKKDLLSDVPADKAFYFNTDVGVYTGRCALNLASFCEILRDVDVKSIEFHMGRVDFEKWIDFLGDSALSREIAKLRGRGLRGEMLRAELVAAVSKRLEKLMRPRARARGRRAGPPQGCSKN
ncbi:MAG: DUF5752 family protein [Candidatus Bathyarchaeia archaeon]